MSACDALEIVKPKLQQGTILMMDDWNCFRADNNQGERRALREFLQNNSNIETHYCPGKTGLTASNSMF
jgi:hypothetical protein